MVRLILFLAWAAALAAGERPLVIAHRGASGYLPEHTAAAKVYAHAQGADYLEQDVVLDRDQVEPESRTGEVIESAMPAA